MTKGNFEPCLNVTLRYEGGWSDHPRDPGGATMKGVTLAVFRRWHPSATKTDLRQISDADVQKIYRVDYWNPVRGDDLPAGVDLATFDFGVNSGVSRSAKYLQSMVGAKQDGVIGAATLEAVAKRDSAGLVKSICAKRLGFVRGLKTFGTFGKGWTRRIADIEAQGVKMALAGYGVAVQRARLQAEADSASKASSAQGGAATGAGGMSVIGASSVPADVNWLIVGAVVVAVLALAVWLASRAKINGERARAYQSVAAV